MYKVKFTEARGKKVRKSVKLRKGRTLLVISFVIFLFLDIFLIGEYKARGANALGYQLMEKVNELFESGSNLVSSLWEPELKTDGRYTSALIVGVDTRNVEFTGTEFKSTKPQGQWGTRNTDTIIQVIYDHSNGNIFMVSIPRDMGVDVNKDCLEFHGSLHWVYDKGQSANCPGGGVQTLVETAEEVTGIDIQYFAFISLESFVDIIDSVGNVKDGQKGIWIDIPEPVYELYPIDGGGWESIYFPEGHQFLTSEDALKFARSRKASSDFARARRQQMVIEAVKDRVVSSDTLLNPKKIYSLYNTFKKNSLYSELSLEEIRAGLNLVRDLDTDEIINIVLDTELGGDEAFLNRRPHDRPGGPYYMVPTHWKECGDNNVFCRVHDYIKAVTNNPDLYKAEAEIFVYSTAYDSTGLPDFSNKKYQQLKKEVPLALKESKYLTQYDGEKSITILDYTDGNKKKVLDALSSELDVKITPGSAASYVRINNEDIAIVVEGDN